MEKENNDNLIIVYAKGDEKVKVRIVDYIKMGFGIYVGYNLARALKDTLLNNIKQK